MATDGLIGMNSNSLPYVCAYTINGEDLFVHGGRPPSGVGGSPPLTLEEEPHGCQWVATWVNLALQQGLRGEAQPGPDPISKDQPDHPPAYPPGCLERAGNLGNTHPAAIVNRDLDNSHPTEQAQDDHFG